ncbi:MAG: magnesium transporter [Thermus sp.]|uniref:magnesium transporter n=1 Tax=Thermus sp. TaxID=275 RepID=UPI0025D5EC17|nr:magnesium transporter [Thermus sp.]MCS6868924.1 magnesium transporter [Thermus sp.]MCS7218791.1 magnesium transporter [Thermus sp.]MCX7848998.1 magnesium transporter [Thermus sp.]MDW8017456.1 magnesium transporter [Thermus sp.]MDW8357273.1 magnesium transporter [Thermus sp.]
MEKALSPLLQALEEGDTLALKTLLGEAHPQDLLSLWDELKGEHRYVVLTLLPKDRAAEVFSHLPSEEQAEYLKTLPPWRVRELLEELSLDDLADALQAVEEEDPELYRRLKEALDPETRAEVEELTQYEEDEAGGLMTPEYVAVREGMSVDEVLRFLRRAAPDAETIYYIYVVDEAGHLKGVLSLRDLIVADPRTKVAEIMNPKVVYVRTDTDQEEVARLMADYDFTVLPVVDEEGKLAGIVTVDDVLDVLEAEATEDIHRLAAVDVPDLVYSQASPVTLWLARVRWLVILILTGMVTSSILQGFERLLDALTALAFYVPVLIGTGGNTGNQSATLIIRALATRDLDLRDWRRVLSKESAVGLLLGLTLALLLLGKVALDGHANLVPVVGLALFLIVLFANLVGALLPFALRRLGVDPALLSNPLIATLTDVTGLLIYLSLARFLLNLG